MPQPDSGEIHFAVMSTQEMGVGLYATHDISAGELIFAERPLLVAPVTATRVGQRVTGLRYENLKDEDPALKRTIMEQAELRIKDAVSRMREDKRDGYYFALPNAHTEDDRGPLFGILRTNGYQIEGLYDGIINNRTLKGYVGVCRVGSRINHR